MSLINKKQLLILLLLTVVSPIFGQEDQIEIATEIVESTKKERYQYLDVDDYEQRTLFKAHTNLSIPFGERIYINNFLHLVSVEQKISPAFSVELGGMLYPDSREENVAFPDYRLRGQFRYYWNKRKSASAKKDHANNFSGNYISLVYDHIYINDGVFRSDPFGYTVYSLRVARQQKVGTWGFYDYGIALQYSRWGNRSSTFGLSVTLDGGVAVGKSKTLNKSKSEDEQIDKSDRIWRGGLVGIGNIRITRNEDNVTYVLSPYTELYLGNFFTLRASIFLLHTRLTSSTSDFKFRGFEGGMSFSVRKYVGVKAREDKGRDLPRFNGLYVSAGVSEVISYRRDISKSSTGFTAESSSDVSYGFNPSVGVGWQQNSGKRLLVSFGGSLRYRNASDQFLLSGGVGVA
ncbi:MAG: hypothetical protein AAFO69_09930, partial [Bacteroidota bacterium]